MNCCCFWDCINDKRCCKISSSNELKPILFPKKGNSISYVSIVVSQNGVNLRPISYGIKLIRYKLWRIISWCCWSINTLRESGSFHSSRCGNKNMIRALINILWDFLFDKSQTFESKIYLFLQRTILAILIIIQFNFSLVY